MYDAARHFAAAFAIGGEHVVDTWIGKGVGYGDGWDPALLDELACAFVLNRLEEDEAVHAAVDEIFELAYEDLAILAKSREDDIVVIELHLAFHLRNNAHGKVVQHIVDKQTDGHALVGAQAAGKVVAAVPEFLNRRLDARLIARFELMAVEVARDRSRRHTGPFGDFLDGGHKLLELNRFVYSILREGSRKGRAIRERFIAEYEKIAVDA